MSELLFQKRFNADSQQLKHLREFVRECAAHAGFTPERVEQLVIGVNEACMNIIEHGYQRQGGEILFEVFSDQEYLVFQLTDFACTVDCSTIKSRELDDIRPGGLGVHFIHEVMDKVEYLPGAGGRGNIIRMLAMAHTKH